MKKILAQRAVVILEETMKTCVFVQLCALVLFSLPF